MLQSCGNFKYFSGYSTNFYGKRAQHNKGIFCFWSLFLFNFSYIQTLTLSGLGAGGLRPTRRRVLRWRGLWRAPAESRDHRPRPPGLLHPARRVLGGLWGLPAGGAGSSGRASRCLNTPSAHTAYSHRIFLESNVLSSVHLYVKYGM